MKKHPECAGSGKFLRGCDRKPTVERDGVHYCWQHDPVRQDEVVAEKRKRAGDRQLFVITHYLHGTPSLEVFPLLGETDETYEVGVRCSSRRLHKGTAGKRYYTTAEAAAAALRIYHEKAHEMAEWAVKRHAFLMRESDDTILKYARGLDDVVTLVDNVVHGKPTEGSK